MGSFKQFNTRDLANQGVEMVVIGPDNKATEERIVVYGNDSDAFQGALAKMRDSVIGYRALNLETIETTGKDEYKEFRDHEQRKLRASLVKSWTFEEPCTLENVIELFRNAPFIADQVDDYASKRARFVKV